MFRKKTKIKPAEQIIVTDREILNFMLDKSDYQRILLEESGKTFTKENIEFLLEVKTLQNMKSKIEIQEQILKIFNHFIESGILNLQSNEIAKIQEVKLKSFNANIYNKAYNNIFNLVINNNIPKIKKHNIFPLVIKEIRLKKNKKTFKEKWDLIKAALFLNRTRFIQKRLSVIIE